MTQGRKTGGRTKGTPNKRTADMRTRSAEAAAAIEAALATSFAGDALAYLMSIYKDKTQPLEYRLEAARAAIRYERPALAAVDVNATGTVKHVILAEPLSPEERDRVWIERHGVKVH